MALTASSTIAAPARSASNVEQAYKILHFGFIVAPIIAGLDKFIGLLADWDKYVAPSMAKMLPFDVKTFMLIVGVVEIAAGIIVALRPKVGAYVVTAWLAVIILNLLMLGNYFDVALRDLGLIFGALALAKLSKDH